MDGDTEDIKEAKNERKSDELLRAPRRRYEMGRKSHQLGILRKSITHKVMKVGPEWSEEERETYSTSRTLPCLG